MLQGLWRWGSGIEEQCCWYVSLVEAGTPLPMHSISPTTPFRGFPPSTPHQASHQAPQRLTNVRRMACATWRKDWITEYVVALSRPVEISSNMMAEAGPHRISPVVTRLRWPLRERRVRQGG